MLKPILLSDHPHGLWKHFLIVSCTIYLLLAAPLAMAQSTPSASRGGTAEEKPIVFRGGLIASIIPDMNITDARAAVKVWAETAAARKGIHAVAVTDVYENISSFRKALVDGGPDVIGLYVDDFLPLQKEGLLEPLFTGLHNGKTTERFVVLVHRASGIADLAALRGRKIIILKGSRMGMAELWLETVLLETKLPAKNQFFGEIKEGYKISRAVLPVFFRQSDACLATLSGFETMVQLNPQVGKDLIPVLTSPEILPGILCMRSGYQSPIKKQIQEALLDLHSDPKGQQVCLLFGVERLIPYNESDLQAARALMEKYQRLSKHP